MINGTYCCHSILSCIDFFLSKAWRCETLTSPYYVLLFTKKIRLDRQPEAVHMRSLRLRG